MNYSHKSLFLILAIALFSILANADRYDSRIGRIRHRKAEDYEPRKHPLIDDDVEDFLQARAYDQLEALATKHPDLRAAHLPGWVRRLSRYSIH